MPERDIELGRFVCPGFFLTLITLFHFFILSPACLGYHILSRHQAWPIPGGFAGDFIILVLALPAPIWAALFLVKQLCQAIFAREWADRLIGNIVTGFVTLFVCLLYLAAAVFVVMTGIMLSHGLYDIGNMAIAALGYFGWVAMGFIRIWSFRKRHTFSIIHKVAAKFSNYFIIWGLTITAGLCLVNLELVIATLKQVWAGLIFAGTAILPFFYAGLIGSVLVTIMMLYGYCLDKSTERQRIVAWRINQAVNLAIMIGAPALIYIYAITIMSRPESITVRILIIFAGCATLIANAVLFYLLIKPLDSIREKIATITPDNFPPSERFDISRNKWLVSLANNEVILIIESARNKIENMFFWVYDTKWAFNYFIVFANRRVYEALMSANIKNFLRLNEEIQRSAFRRFFKTLDLHQAIVGAERFYHKVDMFWRGLTYPFQKTKDGFRLLGTGMRFVANQIKKWSRSCPMIIEDKIVD